MRTTFAEVTGACAPNGLELSCPAEAGNSSLLYVTLAGNSSATESAARRVSFSELLGGAEVVGGCMQQVWSQETAERIRSASAPTFQTTVADRSTTMARLASPSPRTQSGVVVSHFQKHMTVASNSPLARGRSNLRGRPSLNQASRYRVCWMVTKRLNARNAMTGKGRRPSYGNRGLRKWKGHLAQG